MSVGTGNQVSTMITWSDNTKTRLSAEKSFANDGNWHVIAATFTAPQGVTTATITIGNDAPDLYGTNSYIDIGNIKFTEK